MNPREPSRPSVVLPEEPHTATFLPLQPYVEPEPATATTREDLREELRTEVATGFRKATGDKNAKLCYSEKRYAKSTVIKHRQKLVGWPKKIPFRDFNSIRGGNTTLRKLLCRWRKGVLRFESATAEDIEAAKRDPSTVRPGAAKRARPRPPSSPPSYDADAVSALVDNPTPSTEPSGDHPHQQRTNTKKPHGRDLTGRYIRKNPLPKEGIKSKPYIVDSDVEDDFGQAAAEHGEFYFFDEPIPELSPAAEGSMFGLFASSPFASHGRPSGTIRLSDIEMGL